MTLESGSEKVATLHTQVYTNTMESPPSSSDTKHEEPSGTTTKTSLPWTRIVFQIFCLAWLIPILYMVIRNFQGWIIGASSWCPGHNCWADLFDRQLINIWNTAHRLDEQSHDLNGSLQFVAKALEVWFIIIATSLVYLYTMLLAGRTTGLPIRYVVWPNEFSDITSIFSRSLWTAAYSKQNRAVDQDQDNQTGGALGPVKRVLSWPPVFVIITVLLCILCALIGPSVAVVVIPSLQWISTPAVGDYRFNEMSGYSPPSAERLVKQLNAEFIYAPETCTEAELTAQNYGCTATTLGWSLDSLFNNFIVSNTTEGLNPVFGLVGSAGVSSLIYNSTNQEYSRKTSFWTPNRQVLDRLGVDYHVVAYMAQNRFHHLLDNYIDHLDSYKIFNRSLEMRINRNGPMLGARPNFWSNSAWTSRVDSTRSIRCYNNYAILFSGNPGKEYTRCIRMGTGWNPNNKMANFSISGATDPLSGGSITGVNFTASFSDKVAFLENGNLPSWLPSDCLSNRRNGNVPANITCDYERLFAIDVPNLSNRTLNSNTWDLFYPNDTSTPIWSVDFNAYLGFGLYQLNPSPATNPLALVQTLNVPSTGPAIVIDPAWAALAWSADVDGVIPADRTTPLQFISNLDSDLSISNTVALLAALNMLTQIPYATEHRSAATTIDADHPLLQRNGTVYVYAYYVNSRISIFSITIVLIGVVVVLVHAVLYFWHRPHKSIKEVVIAALEHNPQGEFAHANTGQQAVKTRFQVEPGEKGLGELVFRKTRGG